MKKILFAVVFVFGFINIMSAKENSIKINPQKPHPGQEVTVTYNPEGTSLANAGSIEMRVYPWANNVEGKLEKMSSIEMKKEGNVWTAKFNTSKMTDLAAILFAFENKIENNDGNGYLIKLHDENGNETIGSKMGYAVAFGDLNWGRNVLNINPDFKKACSLMDELFKTNPEEKRKNFDLYLTAFLLSKKDNKALTIELLKDEINKFLSYDNLSDNEYKIITTDCMRFGMPEQGKAAAERAIAKYPKGLVAFRKQIESLNLDDKIGVAIEQIDKDFPGQRSNSDIYTLIRKILSEKKPECLKSAIQKNKWLMDDFTICSAIVTNYLTEPVDFDGLKEVSDKYIELSKKEYESPLSERENTVSEKQEVSRRKRQHAICLLIHGETLSRLGLIENAYKSFEQGAELMPAKEMPAKYFEWYVENLVANNKVEQAGPLIESVIKIGKLSDKIKAISKDCYVKKNGSEEGYSEYIASLSGIAKNKNEDELKKKLINKPAPDFTLFDLDGKKVKLSDLKGKVVILDFWATWCGPCKASFPLMKKAQEKYASNPDVVFLFVNTMESVENPKENAAKFIKANKYPFHVLIDKDSEVSKLYGIKGIPSKVFIDKKGNFRLLAMGFNENGFLEEIDTVINYIK